VENGIIGAVSLLELVQRLRDEQCFDSVARQERERGLEKVESPEGGELVEQEQKAVSISRLAAELHRLREPAANLVQHQADDRSRPSNVARGDDQIEAYRPLGVHQVGDPKIRNSGIPSDDGVSIQAKTRHGS